LIQKTSWGTGTKPLENHLKICHTISMNKTNFRLTDPAFIQALRDLPAFLLSTDADLDMAYDWVCEMSAPFANDLAAFDLFYDVYNETFDQAA